MRITSGRAAPRSGPGEPWPISFMAQGALGPVELGQGNPGPIRGRSRERAERSGEEAAGAAGAIVAGRAIVAGGVAEDATDGSSGGRVARAVARAAATGPG